MLPLSFSTTLQEPATAPASPCSDNQPCNPGYSCNAGYCLQLLQNGELCQRHDQCQLEHVCGKQQATAESPLVCCNEAVFCAVPWVNADGHSLLWLCIHLSTGAACLEDRACASGTCVQEHCVEQPVSDGNLCDSNNDCLNHTCAKQAFDENAPLICCPHGDAICFDLPWNEAHEFICSHAPSKTTCSNDRSHR